VNFLENEMKTRMKRERKAVQNNVEIDGAMGSTSRLSGNGTIIR
jgi:hypothetical protein